MPVANFIKGRDKAHAGDAWQYNYGQKLYIHGLELPEVVEIGFSLTETGGMDNPRFGITTDGVTEVVIPDSMMEGGDTEEDYHIYAFIFVEDEKQESGQTIKCVQICVKSRPKRWMDDKTGDDFSEVVKAVRELVEAYKKSGVSDEQVRLALQDYLNDHPLDTLTEDEVKAIVNAMLGDVTQTHFEKVDVLPAVGNENTIYLVPAETTEEQNIYDEYIFLNGIPELIGTTKINLEGYATKEEVGKLSETVNDLKENGTGTGSGATTAQANSLWAVLQKTAFTEQLTEEELNVFKNAWGIVTVVIPATGITLDKTTLSFTDSTSQTLVATVEPSDTTDKVVWSSNNNSVATVTNGVVKPLSNGSATITATCGSVSATCEVTVAMEEEEQVTLTSITATYIGGSVDVGTALTDLTGITVTGHYSDGSTTNITDYTLSGEIIEGSNTITVTYEGLTTTFAVVGVVVTVTGISAVSNKETYAVGTTYANTDITVSVNYSNGKSEEISDYTMLDSGKTISEGENTIKIQWSDGTTNYQTTLIVIGVVVEDFWLNPCEKTAVYGDKSVDVIVTDYNHVKLTANQALSAYYVDISNASQTRINTNLVNMGLSVFKTKYTIPAGATVETTVTWISASFASYASYEFLAVPTGETDNTKCIELLAKTSVYGPNIAGKTDTNTITVENETEINAILEYEQSRIASNTSEFTISIKVNGEEILGVV